MHVVQHTDVNPEREPLWDTVAMHVTDFRPHFDGNAVNLSTCIMPQATIEETISLSRNIASQIANWVVEHQSDFGAGDRFQIIVAWSTKFRQIHRHIIKTGWSHADIKRLAEDASHVEFMPDWDCEVE